MRKGDLLIADLKMLETDLLLTGYNCQNVCMCLHINQDTVL